MKRFTMEELEFLKKNFLKIGGTHCAKRLGRSRSAVVQQAKKLGLKLNMSIIMRFVKEKSFNEYRVNPEPFFNPTFMTNIYAYLLGLIWADGHVSFWGSGCTISTCFSYQDAVDLLPIFQSVGNWRLYITKPKNNDKPAYVVSTNNRPLAEFLSKMDYVAKSKEPATKILNLIPIELHRFWWLGVFDGDGCFYTYANGKYGQISLNSSYEQEWSFFEKLSQDLGIKYKIDRRQSLRGNSSRIRVHNRNGMLALCSFLYPKYEHEIGLRRKFNKAMQLRQAYCQAQNPIDVPSGRF